MTNTSLKLEINSLPKDVRAQVADFVEFLKRLFTEDEVKEVRSKYLIGTSKRYKGATIFWQIDNFERVHAGKILQYIPETGKRAKSTDGKGLINWVHSLNKTEDL